MDFCRNNEPKWGLEKHRSYVKWSTSVNLLYIVLSFTNKAFENVTKNRLVEGVI